MAMSWRRTLGPAEEPITVADAKSQCRIPSEVVDEDGLVLGYIKAARELGEGHTGRGWLTQTWVLTGDSWDDLAVLPMAAPLQSVSSIKYYDADDVLQTLSTSVYVVDTASLPGRVVLASGQSWPGLHGSRLSWRIEVTYVVGWTTTALIPSTLKAGMLLMVDHLWENRGGVHLGVGVAAVQVPFGIDALWGDRVYPTWCH